jgi:transcription termination factor Rho
MKKTNKEKLLLNFMTHLSDYYGVDEVIDCAKHDQVIETYIKTIVNDEENHEMFLNMQYYMEHCRREGYIPPQEWIEKHKHF